MALGPAWAIPLYSWDLILLFRQADGHSPKVAAVVAPGGIQQLGHVRITQFQGHAAREEFVFVTLRIDF